MYKPSVRIKITQVDRYNYQLMYMQGYGMNKFSQENEEIT